MGRAVSQGCDRRRFIKIGRSGGGVSLDGVLRRPPKFIWRNVAQRAAGRVAAKSTCKDRWRQILNEAAKIPRKHLLTLEPSISESQTAEMQSEDVSLVIPHSIHATYSKAQQQWLLTLQTFMEMANDRELSGRRKGWDNLLPIFDLD